MVLSENFSSRNLLCYEIFKYNTELYKMKKILSLFLICIIIQTGLLAQNTEDRVFIKSHTNVSKLKALSESFNNSFQEAMTKAGNNIKYLIISSKGKVGYLSGFDKSGKPVYDFDDNLNAARTSRTSNIWMGGSSGLNLDGAGIIIGHWEASGMPRRTHQELIEKVTHKESGDVTSHATHTACTMIGNGIKYNTGGMASGATIAAHVSNNDEAEIAAFAANGGIISNHSYATGNPDGDTLLYGAYTENSAEWDEIMYNAPYLLVSKSAGNTRNDGVNMDDGGYDILFTVTLSKNLLTVGAVDDVLNYSGPGSVNQSVFTSWGPTDDWRVKPDITANGVGLYSADNISNTAYLSKSGTSMSAAATTGSIVLLQEHYHNLNNVYMKAATVKALLLCTTDELGENDGPDFQSGWGLLNAERAAEVITNNGTTSIINELSISNNETFTAEIEVDGMSPLALTIVWTDPPGVPVSGYDNQTPLLINDLDVRISGNETIYEPWVMVPNITSDNFTDAAIKGDNFRDNIERIDINDLSAGTYLVTVTYKGVLFNGFQDFSMVINGLSENTSALSDMDSLSKSVLIYPVPVQNDVLNIRIPEELYSKDYEIQLIDSYGRLIKTNVYFDSQIKLNLPDLSVGFYLIRIIMDKGVYTKRIIIE